MTDQNESLRAILRMRIEWLEKEMESKKEQARKTRDITKIGQIYRDYTLLQERYEIHTSSYKSLIGLTGEDDGRV